MAVAPPIPSAPVQPPSDGRPMPLDLRKQGLADMLEGKVEQGFGIEDRTDTEATLVTKGRRHRSWFGVSRSGEEFKQRVSVDESGARATRKL
jgi:hypothetical protein